MNQRILLADDSLTIQKVVELTFMDESFDVDAVGSGDEAISSLEESLPDVLIADIHMPGLSGYEVCRRAKEMSASLPVLLLVGTFEPFDQAEVEACGADGHLKKPFDSQELLQIVQRMADADRGPRAAREAAEPPAADPARAGAAAGFDLATADKLDIGGEEIDLGDSVDLETALEEPAAAAPTIPVSTLEEPNWSALRSPSLDAGLSDDESSTAAEPAPDETAETIGGDDETEDAGLGKEPTTDWELASYPPPTPEAELAPTAAEPEFEMPEPRMPEPRMPEARMPELEVPEPETPEPEVERTEPAERPDEAAAGGGLSDQDVERVARRVVEILADDTVREVAWDVIPDMAEIVIKDRIRELEAEAE